MPKTIRIVAYSKYSKSCASLKEALYGNGFRTTIYAENTIETPQNTDILNALRRVVCGERVTMKYANLFINWGNGFNAKPHPELLKTHVFLNCMPLNTYINKKEFFKAFPEVTPAFYTTQAEAGMFLAQAKEKDGPVLVERTVLTGSSGEGIRLLGKSDTPSKDGKLWVEYVPKLREYRIHFFRNATDPDSFLKYTQTKLLSSDYVEADIPNKFQIRNHKNGWIFSVNNNEEIPTTVLNIVDKFLKHKNNSLDFGALDIIYNKKADSAYILEVNTAPGLVGSTLSFYTDCIRAWCN